MGINFILKADVWTCSMNLLVACTSLYNLTSLSTRDLKFLGSQIPLGNCGKLKTLSFPLYDLYPKVHLHMGTKCHVQFQVIHWLRFRILTLYCDFQLEDVVLPGTFNDVWRYFWLSQFEKHYWSLEARDDILSCIVTVPQSQAGISAQMSTVAGCSGSALSSTVVTSQSVAPELLQCGWTKWRCAVKGVIKTHQSPQNFM